MEGSTLLQERLAALHDDPTIKSKAELVRRAGYSESTARVRPGKTVAAVGVQRALAVTKRDRSDRAKGIMDRAARSVGAELDREADPEYALKSWVAAATVLEKHPEADESDYQTAAAKVLADRKRAFALGVRWGRTHPLDVVVAVKSESVIDEKA